MLKREALLGTWALESVQAMRGDEVIDAAPLGADPLGMLHYLPDGRMSVLISHRHRPPLSNGRRCDSDAERARAARTFMAYAGTFDVEDGRVIHHVDMNSHPNDVDVDYPRLASLDGDILNLMTPPDLPPDQRPMRLRWRRYRAIPAGEKL